MTDGETSYAVYTYRCDESRWGSSDVAIGFSTGDGNKYFREHQLSHTSSNVHIGCLDTSTIGGYTTVIYKLTDIGMFNSFLYDFTVVLCL